MAAALTVAAIFRAHFPEFLEVHPRLPVFLKKALFAIMNCRSGVLGSRVVECPQCGHREERPNSCRHRGCPQCEGAKDAAWMQARQDELLPVHYFHVVFTVPHVLNVLFLANPRLCYSLFFQAVAKTLLTVGRNRLKARLGFFAILHTWGQQLTVHHHIHCAVPGGGVKADGAWVNTSKRTRYFAPTKVLAAVFRGILLKALRSAYTKGKLTFNGDFEALLADAASRKWIVYAKPPFGGASAVLKYLSRYTRKVALSNSRLLGFDHGMVSFSFKDYAGGVVRKVARMQAVEFMRRFLQHVPPPGFVRIRYYGFMAGKGRKQRLARLREVIAGLLPVVVNPLSADPDTFVPGRCPKCRLGVLLVVLEIPAPKVWRNSS